MRYILMGICRCAEGKHCGIHFFKKTDAKAYVEEKTKFEVKYGKKGKRTPEFEVEGDSFD